MIFTKTAAIVNIYTDASFRRSDGEVRVGYLITINPDEKNCNVNIISFGSKKITRKVLSTFAAELEAVVYGIRHHALLRKELQRVVSPEKTRLWIDSATLHKSLVGGRSDEGFSSVSLEVARQYICEEGVECNWTQRKYQYADILTHFTALA